MINFGTTGNSTPFFSKKRPEPKPGPVFSQRPTSTTELKQLNVVTLQLPMEQSLSASVIKPDNFDPANPIMTVIQWTGFGEGAVSHHIHINDIDPSNASFLELLALDAYSEMNGKPSGLAHAAASAMSNLFPGSWSGDIHETFDFKSMLTAYREHALANQNYALVKTLDPLLDHMMNHIQRREAMTQVNNNTASPAYNPLPNLKELRANWNAMTLEQQREARDARNQDKLDRQQEAIDAGDFHLSLFNRIVRDGDNHRGLSFRTPTIDDKADIAQRFSDLRQQLIDTYEGDELYKKLASLTQAFGDILQETVALWPTPGGGAFETGSINYPEVNDFTAHMHKQLQQHMDRFFTTFIENIKNEDFYTAFENATQALHSQQTTDMDNVSFRDILLIKDTLRNEQVFKLDDEGNQVLDEYGSPKMEWRDQSMTDVFNSLFSNSQLSSVVREFAQRMIMTGSTESKNAHILTLTHKEGNRRVWSQRVDARTGLPV